MKKEIVLSVILFFLLSLNFSNVAFAGDVVTQETNMQQNIVETSANRLGKYNSKDTRIYQDLTNLNEYSNAGLNYSDFVYYIKKQAEANGITYYLLSTKPSATEGVVGWVKASELTSHAYEVRSQESFTLYLTGTGWAYTNPWGGKQDAIFKDLSVYSGKEFPVDLTLDIGNNDWYRGTINGQIVYTHSNNVVSIEETSASRLGKYKSKDVKIYKNLANLGTYTKAGTGYANYVYYIHKQAIRNGVTYYLLSTKPSATEGIIGWVKASDLTTHSYETKSQETFTLYLTGTGWAYTNPWGGNIDAIFKTLTSYKGQPFIVDQILDVGGNDWYRGKINNQTIYTHSNNVTEAVQSPSNRLGKFKNSNGKIYNNLTDFTYYRTIGSSYSDYVYYIQKQVKINEQVYYLISRKPSDTEGLVGWVKAEDLTTHVYETTSTDSKVLYLTGTGWAYTNPWGGNQDATFKDLSSYAGKEFPIDLTLDVGNNDWYRGTINGQTVYTHTNNVVSIEEKSASRLGKYKNKDVKVYKTLANLGTYTKAGSGYANHVYYIHKQAVRDGVTYYQLSTKPSEAEGVVGWVKASDLTSHSYETKNEEAFTLYLTGTGWAYTNPWGGNQDAIFKNLSGYTGMQFHVVETLDVGNNDWYRGTINGKTVYTHSNNVVSIEEMSTNRLGKYKSKDVKIYKNLANLGTYSTAGTSYANYVYYIHKQAVRDGVTYYLLSTKPSETEGVVGWVKGSDLSSHSYETKSEKALTLYLTGTGWAYTKPWGGNQDAIFKNLSSYEGKEFPVDLTLDVGNNDWYRGTINGQTVYTHSNNVKSVVNSSTQLLGKYKNADVRIYSELTNQNDYITAGSGFADHVYYIYKQAKYNGFTYYLLNSEPNSTEGVVGWVKSSDISTHPYKVLSNDQKTLYLKGTGWAYTDPWGGQEDAIFKNLSEYTNQAFPIDQILDIGNNTWYRGKINGQTIYTHENNVKNYVESLASQLGKFKNATVRIYGNLNNLDSFSVAGSDYANHVYYIKKQAKLNEEIYYLLSREPNTFIGWVKANDLTTNPLKTISGDQQILYLKGIGWAYTDPWGGSEDVVYNNLTGSQGVQFITNLTVDVGNNIWYRGLINGVNVYVHSNNVGKDSVVYKPYSKSLIEALALQMSANPKTDQKYAYIHKNYVKNGQITGVGDTYLKVRTGPGTIYKEIGKLYDGNAVKVIDTVGEWYAVEYKHNTWVTPLQKDVQYYLNPINFINNPIQRFQFLNLAETSGATVSQLNSFLEGKGILSGKGQAFIDAARQYGINDIYLVSHAILETGNGTSDLATGVKYNGVTVYNMFGIGAFDETALEDGARTAYENGWTTPELAIIGGAKFIGNNYVKAGQNTLYKMRWNPNGMENGKASHQYATDIGWAYKQLSTMYNLYQEIGIISVKLEIPVYRVE